MTPAADSIAITAATRDDVPAILRLIQGLAAYEKLSHECVATEASLTATLFGDRPAAEVVVARLNGSPVGFALFFTNYSTFLAKPGIYLEDLFVEEAARGKGVGKALLKHVGRIAHERGCGRYEWSVLDWNTPAIDFYKRVGAVPMDDWTIFRVTGDALRKLAEE